MTRHFCESALGPVHFLRAGAPGATPVVLLHQTPRSIDEYAEVIPILAERHHVVAVDTPGYGCSARPAAPPSIADYAAAVVAVLDAIGAASVHVVGHHTGGVIAVELAAARPDRVASVALSGPVYLDAAGRSALAPHFKQWHVRADGSHLLEKWTKFLAWVDSPALVQRLLVDLFRAGERSEDGHFAVAEYRMEDRLPLVRCPALLVYGTRDPFADRPNAARFEEAFRPATSVDVEGGVFLPNESPGAFAGAIEDFLRRG